MIGKFFDKLYNIYGILVVALFFLLPMFAWGRWGLLLGIVEFFTLGYIEALFGISDKFGRVVLSATSSIALFSALNFYFSFTVPFVPYAMVIGYILILVIMYWSPKAP